MVFLSGMDDSLSAQSRSICGARALCHCQYTSWSLSTLATGPCCPSRGGLEPSREGALALPVRRLWVYGPLGRGSKTRGEPVGGWEWVACVQGCSRRRLGCSGLPRGG